MQGAGQGGALPRGHCDGARKPLQKLEQFHLLNPQHLAAGGWGGRYAWDVGVHSVFWLGAHSPSGSGVWEHTPR